MAGELQYRPFPYDDWGMIRNADGSMFATVSRPEAYKGEFDQHREEETDPFAELARRVIFFEALERENATLRAERGEARKALEHAREFVQAYDTPAMNPDQDRCLAQIDAAIRNMGGGENES